MSHLINPFDIMATSLDSIYPNSNHDTQYYGNPHTKSTAIPVHFAMIDGSVNLSDIYLGVVNKDESAYI